MTRHPDDTPHVVYRQMPEGEVRLDRTFRNAWSAQRHAELMELLARKIRLPYTYRIGPAQERAAA